MTAAVRPPLLNDANFQRLRDRVVHATGVHLAHDRRTLIASRLHKRLRALRLADFDSYLDLLDSDPLHNEQQHLLGLLIAHDSYFFREHRHFEFLARWLPGLGHPPRLWSAACASGEEAWSLAMVCAEHAPYAGWEVLASDCNGALLQQANVGVYDIAQARYFPDGWLGRHCLCGVDDMAGRLRIAPALREQVRFETINLIHPLPTALGAFDVIVLRNLLASFTERHRADVLRRVVLHLRPGGVLVIGHSESIHGLDLPLRPLLPSVFERL
ncbi:protein-glutamate O-methyltransferase CheR [Pseudomonas entomophila]|uniref:CheR family methyltransferase n=1 Tax=Pseudomonas entomophila TaxID=312306 RepID=UPI0023D7BC12|nr:protein-glutamate O-methyltransferase CheR [Pseudomonas entomophila]MDF0734110.1 protein-glutamate O-methyltransferase CheR [Pseudomonas entomophila]